MTLTDPDSIPSSALGTSFVHYAENRFPTEYKLEAWCPTADLLALISNENMLELYRLSWKQHWSVPVKEGAVAANSIRSGGIMGFLQPQHAGSTTSTAESVQSNVVSIGKMIAVGLGNGQVNVYDYRDGSVLYTLAPGAGNVSKMRSIRCLKWTDIYLGQSTQVSFFGAHQSLKSILEALPLLSPVPLSSTQQQMLMLLMTQKHINKTAAQDKLSQGVAPVPEAVDEKDEESSDIMNVLFAGDNHGCFKLKLFGSFEVKAVSLLDLMESYGVKRFKTLNILDTDIQLDLSEFVIIALGTQHHGQPFSTERRVLRIAVASDLLRKRSREIRTLGLKKRVVNSLLKYLSDSLRIMQDNYRKLNQMVEDCTESIEQLLSDNGEMTTPTYEFLQLLMTGRPSISLDQTEHYKALRLEETLVYNCIKIAGDYIGLIERLFLALKAEMKHFDEFRNWMEH
ncbi:Anaphase-promoting complex subunit 4, partial [Modicella reniformis]